MPVRRKLRRPAQRLWMASTLTMLRSSMRIRRERHFIFVGLSVARAAWHLVHRRRKQPPAFWREIKLVADRLGEWQPAGIVPSGASKVMIVRRIG